MNTALSSDIASQLIALLADIHANREALTACLAHARGRGAERLVFLGDYVGYGAEDTDLGFRIAREGLPLLFAGDAPVFHQHHEGYDPPLQHFRALIANAKRFHAAWSIWPMDGWLTAMADLGLVDWSSDDLIIRRDPTPAEIAAARKDPANPF